MSISAENLISLFESVRNRSEVICKPLAIEDYSVQPVPDVSPPKWHLAHTTWFFEQFVLVPNNPDYKVFNEDFAYFFNSYYNNAGERVFRSNRGDLTRPAVQEVYNYRNHVTSAVLDYLKSDLKVDVLDTITLGINHEQQHQELLAYDIKYILGFQPFYPPFETDLQLTESLGNQRWVAVDEDVYEIGFQGEGFCFDNELGRHKTYIQDFEISNHLVTNAEFMEFIEDGGYQNFNLWHASGWDWVQQKTIKAPLYWEKIDGVWKYYDYSGLKVIDPDLPVMNVSYYEAYAFAEWKGMRLPTEQEWEVAAERFDWGQLWEWTESAYLPYPNFEKAPGALGEYNGKFMVNQMVLRGGSFATPQGHSRITYRNFFHAHDRWQFSGIRLVK